MAKNVLKAGRSLVVFDTNQAVLREFEKLGNVRVASSPKDVASQQPGFIITMLPEGRHVRSVYLGQDGILSGVRRSLPPVLIDSSTIDIDTSKDVSKSCQEIGARFVDAPVSGGKSM